MLFVGVFILTLYVSVPVGIALKFGWQWWHIAILLLIVTLAYHYLLWPYIRGWRAVRKLKSSGKEPGVWAFSGEGIEFKNSASQIQLKWNNVRFASVTRHYIMLNIGAIVVIMSPSMFKTNDDYRCIRAILIRNFGICRACGYDLHGTSSDTCPECGKSID